MSLYTKTGDDGETGLFGSGRVAKSDERLEAYGTVDELNAVLGVVRNEELPAGLDDRLAGIQSALFDLGADLATVGGNASCGRLLAMISDMEQWIDASEKDLQPLRTFVLPGGHRSAAQLHVARTVCRRAERAVWRLAERDADTEGAVPLELGRYLNRLSDLLFSWSRLANAHQNTPDVPWQRAKD